MALPVLLTEWQLLAVLLLAVLLLLLLVLLLLLLLAVLWWRHEAGCARRRVLVLRREKEAVLLRCRWSCPRAAWANRRNVIGLADLNSPQQRAPPGVAADDLTGRLGYDQVAPPKLFLWSPRAPRVAITVAHMPDPTQSRRGAPPEQSTRRPAVGSSSPRLAAGWPRPRRHWT